MTPDQIAAMEADILAGTPGDWVLIESIPQEGWNGWYLKGQPSTILRGFTYEICNILGPQSSKTQAANARRIARVPLMEAAIIAQAAEIARLREALEWYAEKILTYSITQMDEPRSAAHEDKGARARAALEATP